MNYRCLIMVYAAWVEAVTAGRSFCPVNQQNLYMQPKKPPPPTNQEFMYV